MFFLLVPSGVTGADGDPSGTLPMVPPAELKHLMDKFEEN